MAEANRKYYSITAHLYDATETCVVNSHSQQMLENDLDLIIQIIGRPPGEILALDACGGSGNVSQKLSMKGVKVTLCDISQELIELCIAKIHANKSDFMVVNSEITQYLEHDSNFYDLVVFSSALHHLINHAEVLRLCFQRLNPGGLVYTVFDPTLRNQLSLITSVLLETDYLLFKARYQPVDMVLGSMRRFRRFIRALFRAKGIPGSSIAEETKSLNADYVGVVAEYYARTGIDDMQLANLLKDMGYSIVFHERYAEARHDFIRKILTSMKQITAFKFLLQKPLQV